MISPRSVSQSNAYIVTFFFSSKAIPCCTIKGDLAGGGVINLISLTQEIQLAIIRNDFFYLALFFLLCLFICSTGHCSCYFTLSIILTSSIRAFSFPI